MIDYTSMRKKKKYAQSFERTKHHAERLCIGHCNHAFTNRNVFPFMLVLFTSSQSVEIKLRKYVRTEYKTSLYRPTC